MSSGREYQFLLSLLSKISIVKLIRHTEIHIMFLSVVGAVISKPHFVNVNKRNRGDTAPRPFNGIFF